jgi:ferrous iron transport protein A
VSEASEITLSELAPGARGVIASVRGGPGFRARLRALGLAEGQSLQKLSRVGLGGPVVVLVNRAQVAVGRGMAGRIVVRPEVDG